MTIVTVRRVAVLGSGVIGTSIALALRHRGVHVDLADRDPAVVAEAVRLGAGQAWADGAPPADVVVIATPPSAVVTVLREAQRLRMGTVYTDVASAKAQIIALAELTGCDLAAYVPGHPMGGRELSGPSAARADLFIGRPWALCPHPATGRATLRAVTDLVALCGAEPRLIPAEVHDRAVAAVSHAPHLVSCAIAAHFQETDQATLSLAGKGLQDMTRIAAGAPHLWRDILQHNAGQVAAVLETIVADLSQAAAALRGCDPGARDALNDLLVRGARGHRQIAEQRGPSPVEQLGPDTPDVLEIG
jgi:prephenate dehydrogenase